MLKGNNKCVVITLKLTILIILRSESIVTTLEGDLLDSLHQSNLIIISECKQVNPFQ